MFFLGRQPASEMSRLLSLIDIAVAPHSQMKGEFYFCPLKILEYAAVGCATVASNQGDIPWLLADGKGGVIVEDDRLESWTNALEGLIADETKRKQTARIAREHVLNNLTWKHTARQVNDVLIEALHDRAENTTQTDNASFQPVTDEENHAAETIGA